MSNRSLNVNQGKTQAMKPSKPGKNDLVILICSDWSHCAVSNASDITAWRSAIALALVSLLFASDGQGELVHDWCRA